MSRTEWLRWVVRWGTPGTRVNQVRRFFMFEVYRRLCRLFGLEFPHALEQMPLPAGRYLAVEKPVPRGVRLLDRLFASVKDEHVEYIPYSPERERELRRQDATMKIIDVSYEFRFGGVRR